MPRTVTVSLSWADTFKFFSQTLSLTSTRFFHVLLACCWHCSFLLFTGSGVPSLPVSLSSRPFGTCFIQPTIRPLGLKASDVHDHCKRRRSGHRISNLLNTWTSDEPPGHNRHPCGRLHTLELAGVPTIYSHSLNSSAPAYSRCRDSFKIAAITAAVTYFQEYSQVLHKMGTTISLAQPGYPLLCRCTKSVAPPQY